MHIEIIVIKTIYPTKSMRNINPLHKKVNKTRKKPPNSIDQNKERG